MPAPIQKQMKIKIEKRHHILDKLYESFEPLKEYQNINTAWFADSDITDSQAKDYIKEIAGLGILQRRLEYGTPQNGLTRGRHFHWTLLVTKEEALRRLHAEDERALRDADANFLQGVKQTQITKQKKQKQNGGKPLMEAIKQASVTDGLAVEKRGDEPVAAITGPEPESPFRQLAEMRKDEPHALVVAARQYRDRTSKVDTRIDDLLSQARELGLTVDEDALRSSITFDHDERLETVGLVLPYIDRLEREAERHLDEISGLRTQLRDLADLRRKADRLKTQNERLLAQQVAKGVVPPTTH